MRATDPIGPLVRPGTLPFALSVITGVAYLGFMLASVLARPLFGVVLGGGITVGVLLALLLILLWIGLSLVFMLVANRRERT